MHCVHAMLPKSDGWIFMKSGEYADYGPEKC